MGPLAGDLGELRAQLGKGSVQRAYAAIVGYVSRLRAHFAGREGERAVSGVYQGCFDMTYFALFPPALRSRDLKIAIVLDYEAFAFEVWLAARNRKVQRRYWELFRDSGWSKYRLVEPAIGVDAIVEQPVGSGFWTIGAPLAEFKVTDEAVALTADEWRRFLAEGVLSAGQLKACSARDPDEYLEALNPR